MIRSSRSTRQWAAVATAAAVTAANLSPALLAQSTTMPATQKASQSTPRGAYSSDGHTSVILPPSTRKATEISLNFHDASVDEVLEHMSDVLGFEVVKDAPVDGRVTLLSKQPVSADEAVALLNTVLKGNGFTAIRMGRILKITSRDKAKHENLPVHYGAEPDDIPETDDLITQVIPVRSVDATKLKTDIQPLVNPDADLTSNGGSNTIILTDTSANIKRVVQIIANLDKKDALENGIRVKQLKYADATAAAKLITDIFKSPDQQNQQQFQGPGAFFRAFRGGGGGGGGGGGAGQAAEDKGRTGTVLASADTRTNTVVVSGPDDTLKVIDDVLTQIDSNPASDQTFFMYRVQNGQAVDIAATLNNLFGTSTSGSSSTSSNTRSGTSSNNRTSSSGSSGFGGSGSSGSSGFGGSGGGSSGFGGSGSSSSSSGSGAISRTGFNTGNSSSTSGSGRSSSNGRSGSGSSLSPDLQALTGEVLVVPDADTNSLLVATGTKYETQVRALIADLDRPVPQVLIKVLVAEVTHDSSDDLGLDFSVLNTRASGNGTSLISSLGNAAAQTANGGLAVSVVESNLTTTLHALATAGKLDVLSRPYILASDNQEANILVGQEVPFITDSRITDEGQQINTIQYRDIGIILDVTPHVNSEGLVILDVNPEISSQADQSVQIQAGVFAPVFNSRSASSRVGIKDGETIVIGGLMQDQKTQTVTKVPILGNLPLIGLLFSRNQVSKVKTELLIFLTPHVAQAPERLRPMSQDEINGLRLTPSAVGPGVFQEHIRGLQRGGPATQPSNDELPPPVQTHVGASPPAPTPGN